MLPYTRVGTMLLTQVLILVHHRKVAVFMKNLPHLKVLASYLVWNLLDTVCLKSNGNLKPVINEI